MGDKIGRTMIKLGSTPLPWQQYVADVAGELLPDGRMAYPVVVMIVPRRGGKTHLTLARHIQKCAAVPRTRTWYTAQTGGDAGDVFRDEWTPLVKSSAFARRIKVRLSNGSMGLNLPNGSRMGVFAPTERALHGKDSDEADIDEAWAFDAIKGAQLEAAIRPTMLTRPRRQLWIFSAGGTADSEWLLNWRALGRGMARDTSIPGEHYVCEPDQGVAYFEWYPPVSRNTETGEFDLIGDLDDPALWAATHPAVGHTIDLQTLRDDRKSMSEELFQRSILNVFSDAAGDRILPKREWDGCHDQALVVPRRAGHLAYAVALDHSYAAIAYATKLPDGRVGAELVDYRPGIDWLPTRVAELRNTYSPEVAADSYGPVKVATRLLRSESGLEPYELSTEEYSSACMELRRDVTRLVDGVHAPLITFRPQLPLDTAAGAAGRRELGDGWAFSQKKSGRDIACLIALTVAAHRARHQIMATPRILV